MAKKSAAVDYEPLDLPYYGEFKELSDIDGEVEELRDLTELMDKVKAEIEDQKMVIQSLMEAVPGKGKASYSVRITEDLGISYIKAEKGRETLVKELLILAGVTEKQLKKGTKKSPPNKPYVQLLLPTKKQKEDKMRAEARGRRGE